MLFESVACSRTGAVVGLVTGFAPSLHKAGAVSGTETLNRNCHCLFSQYSERRKTKGPEIPQSSKLVKL
jgi:hypothetical protein